VCEGQACRVRYHPACRRTLFRAPGALRARDYPVLLRGAPIGHPWVDLVITVIARIRCGCIKIMMTVAST